MKHSTVSLSVYGFKLEKNRVVMVKEMGFAVTIYFFPNYINFPKLIFKECFGYCENSSNGKTVHGKRICKAMCILKHNRLQASNKNRISFFVHFSRNMQNVL